MYGIDLDARPLRERSWRWLRVRILGLFDIPPVITPDGRPVHTTRIGLRLDPPPAPKG